MKNLTDFAIHHEYERIEDLGDRSVEIGNRINWDDFKQKLDILFCNNTERDVRPNIDVIVMLRCLFIQQLYLSNEQLERELAFRERLADSGVDTEIWYALQKQLDAMKLKVEMGIMQDTSFMTSILIMPRVIHHAKRKPRLGGTKSYFGYKLHGAIP